LWEKRAIPTKNAGKDAGATRTELHVYLLTIIRERHVFVKGKAGEKLALATLRGGAIIGALDTLVDIGAPAEKEVIQ